MFEARRAGLAPIDETKFARAFRYYRHRFQARPLFGQVSWLAQACLAWWRVKADPLLAELACEIADWILRFQQQKSGAFLNDHQSDTPGYTTALPIWRASPPRPAWRDARGTRFASANTLMRAGADSSSWTA
jgi:hypothetical protein